MGYYVYFLNNNSTTGTEVTVNKSEYYFVFKDNGFSALTLMTEDDWYTYFSDTDSLDLRPNYIYLNSSFVRFDFGN